MSPTVVVVTLTLPLGLLPLTTDPYLPTLPTVQPELGASIGATQLTLSALIICFGLGQLVVGPLAQNIEALIGWRALQGEALAAAVTCGRSRVRDLDAPHDGARVMLRALGGLGQIAILSPVVGGLLVQGLSWHAALLASAVFGAGTFGFVAIKFDESRAQRDPLSIRPAQLLRSWRQVLAHPALPAGAALLCCTWGGRFFVLPGSPFVFTNGLGTSRLAYGTILPTSSLADVTDALLCRPMPLRHGLRSTVKRGVWFSLAGGVSMATLSLAGVRIAWAIRLPQWPFAVDHGIHRTYGQVGVIDPFPHKAGTAASQSGFAMMFTAFGIGLWLGHTLDHSTLSQALGAGAFGVAVAPVAWTLAQCDGDPVSTRAAAAFGSAAPQ